MVELGIRLSPRRASGANTDDTIDSNSSMSSDVSMSGSLP
eukprot:SAG31_NODE_25561_length_459_cov_0.638889_1_plen_39_part_10